MLTSKYLIDYLIYLLNFRLEEYSNTSLKNYFDQNALMFPIEEIVDRVEKRDYRFFL